MTESTNPTEAALIKRRKGMTELEREQFKNHVSQDVADWVAAGGVIDVCETSRSKHAIRSGITSSSRH